MSGRSLGHASFTVERSSDASPDRLIAASSDQDAKTRWWGRSIEQHDFDFRVGRRELQRRWSSGPTTAAPA